jgi:hypothetical protein
MSFSAGQISLQNRVSEISMMEFEERQSCLFVPVKLAVPDMPLQLRKFSKQNEIFMERRFTIAT